MAAREISGALRQHILVQDSQVLDKYREKGVEIIHLDEADIVGAREKAVESWKKATKGDDLATRIVISQIDFMQTLGLI